MDCSFEYPTLENAVEAGKNLYAMLTGSVPRDLACMAHCGWVVGGFGLSMIPHDHPPIVMTAPSTEEALAEALKPLALSHGSVSADALPWAQIALIVLELVKEWLRNR